jgi:hypothetical protein
MKNIATAQIFTSRGQQEVRASIPNSKNLRSYTKSQFVNLSTKELKRKKTYREPTGTGRQEGESSRKTGGRELEKKG